MPATVSAPRYLSRFRCIAERCEDPCCTGLEIPVSAERAAAIRSALSGEPGAARASFLVSEPGGGARIPQGADKRCPFFDADGLCSLQRRYGEEVMPDICVSFPRVLSRQGEQLEMAGTLACPEVARLCLLDEDAMEETALPAEAAKRPELATRPAAPAEPSTSRAARVRAAALALIEQRGYPLGSRLAFLGQLALQMDGVPSAAPGESPEAPEARLAEVLEAFEQPAVLDAIHAQLSGLQLPAGLCAGLLASVLRSRLRTSPAGRFATLAAAVLGAYGAEGEQVDPAALGRIWEERRSRLDALDPGRVDQYFRHASANHWRRDPFTAAPRALAYVFTLALRAGLWRFALAGHPVVDALGPGEAARSPEARARLDAAAVETFQLLAKHVERHADFLGLAAALAGDGADTLGKVLVFARFC